MGIDELINCGDQVLAMSRQHGRGATSGASTELVLGQIVTIRDGKVVQVDNCTDRKKALEAAGLSE